MRMTGRGRLVPLFALCFVLALAGVAPARAGGLAEADLRLLEAATWGVTPGSAAAMAALGRERWLDGQLHPERDRAVPAEVRRLIEAAPGHGQATIDVVRDLQERQQAAGALTDPEAKRAAQQANQAILAGLYRGAQTVFILKAVYGPDQLAEKATWFWFNRFNVHAAKANIRAMVGDYVERAVRPHAVGRFRDLLGATLRHPAMLRYLDNTDNAAGRSNENYARELMELHTMGVGSGYTQADVEALARILTGLGLDPRPDDPKLKPELRGQLRREGLFEFNPARHDYGEKVFLGHRIAGSGMAEVEQALDILARHPATARNVSRAIAAYFGGDEPPDALVLRMAETFAKTDGDIAAVLKTMFTAPEFAALRTRHFKDPMQFVISAVRFAYGDKVILNTQPIQNWLGRLGEGLFNRTTPDGYPVGSAAWSGPGQMSARFEVARQIGGGPAGLFKPVVETGEPPPERPGFPVLQNELYFTTLRDTLSPATRAALAEATSPQDWNMLFLSSPEFGR